MKRQKQTCYFYECDGTKLLRIDTKIYYETPDGGWARFPTREQISHVAKAELEALN